MGLEQKIDPALAASLLNWWREAGVDTLIDENPRDWLAAPVEPVRAPATVRAPAPVMVRPVAPLPETLDAFLAWRMGDAAPDADWPGVRVGPQGSPGSALMVVIDCPERNDTPARLLGGDAGVLFDRMMAAIGQSRDTICLASMAVVAPPSGRLPARLDPLFADALRRHIALAAPRRLLVLGSAASRALFGMDVAQARGSLRGVNHDGREDKVGLRAVASFSPRFLLERPAAKAQAWKDLQLLIGGMA